MRASQWTGVAGVADAPSPSTIAPRVLNTRLDLPVGEGDFRRWDAVFKLCSAAAPPPLTADAAVAAATRFSPFSAFEPDAFAALPAKPMSMMLKHKQQWLKHASQLPAYKSRQPILDACKASHVVVVSGETGAGKSTQLPGLVLGTDWMKKRRLVIIEPSEAAALRLAARLREELGEPKGVEAAVAGVVPAASVRVVVTTAGGMLRSMIADPRLEHVGCVIVDETQQRTLHLDALMWALRATMLNAAERADDDSNAAAPLRALFAAPLHASHVERHVLDFFASLRSANPTRVVIPATNAEARLVDVSLADAAAWVTEAPTLPEDAAALAGAQTLAALSLTEALGEQSSFEVSPQFAGTWGSFIVKCAAHYDAAATAKAVAANRSSIAVSLPTALHCAVVAGLIGSDHPTLAPVDMSVSGSLWPDLGGKRLVALFVGDDFTGAFAPSAPFGLLIDSARQYVESVDAATHQTRAAVELSPKLALKLRRDTVAAVAVRPAHKPIAVSLAPASAAGAHQAPASLVSRVSPAEWQSLAVLLTSLDQLKLSSAATMAKPQLRAHERDTAAARLVLNDFPGAQEAQQHSDVVISSCTAAEAWLSAGGVYASWRQGVDAPGQRRGLSPLGALCCAMPVPIAAAKLLVYGLTFGCYDEAIRVAASWTVPAVFRPASADEAGDAAAALAYASGATPAGMGGDIAAAYQLSTLDECGLGVVDAARDRTLAADAALRRMLAASGMLPPSIVDDKAGELCTSKCALLSFATAAALYPNAGVHIPGTEDIAIGDSISAEGGNLPPHVAAVATPIVKLPELGAASTPVRMFTDAVYGNRLRHAVLERTIAVGAVAPAVAAGSASASATQPSITARQVVPTRRCRGWFAPVTTAWRETGSARQHLPAEVQMRPKPIKTQLLDVAQADEAHVTADTLMTLSTTAPAAHFVGKARLGVKLALAEAAVAAAHGTPTPSSASQNASSKMAASADLVDLVRWMIQREQTAAGYSRERRAAGKVEPPKRNLVSAFPFTYAVGEMPTRRPDSELSSSVEVAGAAGTAGGAAAGKSGAFSGPVPSDEETRLFVEKAAQTVAARGNRDKEQELIVRLPDKFAFLDHRHALHGFYLHRLQHLNPSIKVLGDDLLDLREYLDELEVEIGGGSRFAATVEAGLPQSHRQAHEEQQQQHQQHQHRDAAYPHSQYQHPQQGRRAVVEAEVETRIQPSGTDDRGNEINAGAEEETANFFDNVDADEPPVAQRNEAEAHGMGLTDPGFAVGQVPHGCHPLSVAPPPLVHPPAKEDNSVYVSPLPAARPGMDMRVILAMALGDSIDDKVGPVLMLGNAARIKCRSKAVLDKCLAKGAFYCLGDQLTIERNTHIFEGPEPDPQQQQHHHHHHHHHGHHHHHHGHHGGGFPPNMGYAVSGGGGNLGLGPMVGGRR